MAIVVEFVCVQCGHNRSQAIPSGSRVPKVCAICEQEEFLKVRRMALASLTGLTVEERLAKLEAQAYDTDAGARLRRLELERTRY
jgi:hypothetical protein